jgi:hypothetical protein
MKKTKADTETCICGECWKSFGPPGAANQLRIHYDIEHPHEIWDYVDTIKAGNVDH